MIRSCRSHPTALSSATAVPELSPALSAPYAASPTIAVTAQSSVPPEPPPTLVNMMYMSTGVPMPKMTKPVSRNVRRSSRFT